MADAETDGPPRSGNGRCATPSGPPRPADVERGDPRHPRGLLFAHALTRGLARLRESRELPYLRPDGKAQVSVEYGDRTRMPRRIAPVVVSTQHAPEG